MIREAKAPGGPKCRDRQHTKIEDHAAPGQRLLDGRVQQLLVHHPQGQLVLHVVPLLLGLVVGQGVDDPAVCGGVVPAAILVDKVRVGEAVVVAVVVPGGGQLLGGGRGDPGAGEGGGAAGLGPGCGRLAQQGRWGRGLWGADGGACRWWEGAVVVTTTAVVVVVFCSAGWRVVVAGGCLAGELCLSLG